MYKITIEKKKKVKLVESIDESIVESMWSNSFHHSEHMEIQMLLTWLQR